jgi:hypothetical protein
MPSAQLPRPPRSDCWRFPISWRRNCSRSQIHTKPKILVAREIREALEHIARAEFVSVPEAAE